MALLVILASFGLATAIIGKLKGSSFFIWFLVDFCLPLIGLIGALAYIGFHGDPIDDLKSDIPAPR